MFYLKSSEPVRIANICRILVENNLDGTFFHLIVEAEKFCCLNEACEENRQLYHFNFHKENIFETVTTAFYRHERVHCWRN